MVFYFIYKKPHQTGPPKKKHEKKHKKSTTTTRTKTMLALVIIVALALTAWSNPGTCFEVTQEQRICMQTLMKRLEDSHVPGKYRSGGTA